jgi:hypothetical protein
MPFAMTSDAMHDTSIEYSQHCRIRVRGVIDPSLSVRLGGLQIAVERFPDRPAETVLSGDLPDQAALHGVLSSLYMLGHRLLYVEAH